MPELLEDETVEAIRIRAKWENDDYICRGHILNGMSDSLFDVYTNVELAKELLDSLESKYMAEDSSSKKFLMSNFNNYKMVYSRPVMEQYNKLLMILGQYTQHDLKMDKSISISNIFDKFPPSWKDFKHTLKHGKDDLSLVQLGSHLRIEESLRAQDSDKGKGKEVGGPSVNMTERGGKNKHHKQNKGIVVVVKRTTQMLVVREKGIRTNPKTKVDAIAWWIDSGATTHVCKDRCWFKTFEPVEDGYLLYMGDEHFALVHGKGSVALEFSSRMFNVLYVPKLRVIHETTAPYTPHQNGVAERNNRALKEMVNSMLSYSGLSEGFWGEAMLTACYLLNGVHNKRNKTSPYELWYKKRPNLSFLRVWDCRAVVRLPDPKRKTLGEKSIDCIFVGYAEHSKAYMFYVIEPNDSVSINSIIESRDAIFDENHFYSIPRPKDIIPNSNESQRDDHFDDVPSEISKPRKGKRVWKAKSYGSDFQLYLVKGSGDQVGSQYSYCYSIEEDPRTYNEAMQSQDAAFWKEAIDDEIRSIMENNTWVLSDLPPCCKPLGCKWIFKKKMKVDETIDKFKARLKFLSSRFSMKDMGEADVILGIKIKRKNKGIVITQSHYIEKVLKKFNHEDCSSVSTLMDPVEKLKPNTGKPVDQLEYSRATSFLMYAMTSTRPDIAYAVGRLSRFNSNPSRQHQKAITKIFKFIFYEWMGFLLGGCAISWASKKQTCITGSTMEYEFVALAAAGKEAKWLKNLIHEILICPKPIAPISIRSDSASTMARAYSHIYNGKSKHLGWVCFLVGGGMAEINESAGDGISHYVTDLQQMDIIEAKRTNPSTRME
nr:zinc finger, CCHC-type [Tanacetum cinerariifolium]